MFRDSDPARVGLGVRKLLELVGALCALLTNPVCADGGGHWPGDDGIASKRKHEELEKLLRGPGLFTAMANDLQAGRTSLEQTRRT